jgi:hypothetical protein
MDKIKISKFVIATNLDNFLAIGKTGIYPILLVVFRKPKEIKEHYERAIEMS